MEKYPKERILILAKTYPSPSAQYIETSCVAGINQYGLMRRLYPVPFRLIQDSQKFKKWQWVNVRVEKARNDHRLESHKLYVDTIECLETISTKNEWDSRRIWLNKTPSFGSFDAMDNARLNNGISIALLHPKKLIQLEIQKSRNQEWTKEEKAKLAREQMQGNLFSEIEAKRQVKELRKVPYDFYYRYLCDTPDGEKEYRHKIVDWEAGMLFWKCQRNHGSGWEIPFRAKLQDQLGSTELMFLLGNQHRFQDQWLIISLIYPPKRKPIEVKQGSLF